MYILCRNVGNTVKPPSNGNHWENDFGPLLGGIFVLKSSIGRIGWCRYSEVYLYTSNYSPICGTQGGSIVNSFALRSL